ncbi:MAG: chemotaxis protein CheA [Gammaproteobacteria bacterium]|nr:MAG: chemotaxis protein CheA [Gammaproteobacteria bacterium]
MAIDTEDEIVQDFLVESREILESLSEQLVGLEQCPDDTELLNAVFRGFHTIKGGAGFLNLESLVEVCHITEDLFNLLRQGDLKVTPVLMDVVLQALDVVNDMFGTIETGVMPDSAPRDLISKLEQLRDGKQELSDESTSGAASSGDITDNEFEEMLGNLDADTNESAEVESTGSDISDDEFENILSQVSSGGGESDSQGSADNEPELFTNEPEVKPEPEKVSQSSSGGGDKITDDEFENLLDQLHGKGNGPSVGEVSPAPPSAPAATSVSKEPEPPKIGGGDKITDDEFENLLDEMHGKGAGPTSKKQKPVPKSPIEEPIMQKPAEPAASDVPKAASSKPNAAPVKAGAEKAGGVKAETTVRVDTARLDDIMNLVGELVLVRNRLTTIRGSFEDENLNSAVSDLELVTSDLQAAVMKTRMQPIKKVFGRFPRVVRDLARSLNKEIELELRGEETDLDKNLVEALADPLVHLVRNSVDHGIEAPEDRLMAGKSRNGKIILGAEQEGDHILLTIADDGGGMDPNMLRKKVIEKGLMDSESAARLDDKDCFNLIFLPGFSTKAEISDISGRGVGMDVVKTRISQLNGSIDIDSELGEGTTISIKVPLTLAILPTLMVTLCDRKFAIPMSVVREIFELDPDKTNVVDGQLVVMVRDKAMPIFFLEKWLLNMPGADILNRNTVKEKDASVQKEQEESMGLLDDFEMEGEDERQVVTVVIGNMMVGFVVDEVIGLEEVVIKPLGAMLQGLAGLAGSTITGDGRIALIVDIPSLIKEYGNSM